MNLYHTVSFEVVHHVQGALANNINLVLGAEATCKVPFYKSRHSNNDEITSGRKSKDVQDKCK